MSDAAPGGQILPAAVYQPRFAPVALPSDLRLKSVEWGVLFALTGRHTVAQVAARLGLPPSQARAAFQGLLAANLIVERALDLGDYLQAVATTGDPQAKTLADLLAGVPLRPQVPPVTTTSAGESARRPASVAPSSAAGGEPARNVRPAPPAKTAPTGGAVAPRAASKPLPPRPAAPPPTFRPLAIEEPAMPTASERALSLRALMRFIRGRAQDETAGQLDVYRAFLLVDPELLKRHGITTLRFEDDRMVRDDELKRRILESVEATLGVQAPPDVFV